MGEVTELVRGIPHRNSAGELSRLSCNDYWALQEDKYETNEGYPIEGITDVELVVSLQNGEPTYSYQLATGLYGAIPIPHNFDFPSDHLVVDGIWFPINQDIVHDLELFSRLAEVKAGEPLSRRALSELVRLSNSSEVKVVFADDIEELFGQAPTPPALGYELALKPWDYQARGIEWLVAFYSHGMGAILSDQMGLGKTLQMLGLIAAAVKNDAARVLLVVPNSLRLNWQKEIEKFLPSLQYLNHHGPDRNHELSELENHQVILTTYDLLTYDEHNFLRLNFDLAVFDEAHALKSPNSRRRDIASKILSPRKVLSTGTPFENSLMDLWSLIDIVQPGILGSRKYFDGIVHADGIKARNIGDMVAPLILRRTLDQVGSDIPDSHENVEYFQLDGPLADSYEALRIKKHPETIGSEGWGIATKLRMFLSEPSIFRDFPPGQGQKFERLCEVLDEIWLLNEKVIIFLPYLDAIDALSEEIGSRFASERVFSVDGRSTADDRFQTVENFQTISGFAVLLANPRAAGQGLNIARANHVIHYSPDWNPAQQDQATFRVLRPGQDKEVFVHRFIYAETIEEVMDEALSEKRDTAEAVLSSSESEGSSKSLEKALSLSPRRNN